MPLQPQITFRNIDATDAVKQQVEQRAAELEQIYDRIVACKIMVETSHHHHQGGLYHVAIHLTLPGDEIVVKRDPPAHQAHEDIQVAIHDAFTAARRQLEDHVRRVRDDVRHPVSRPEAE